MREYQSVDHSPFTDEEERAAVAAIIAERDALRDEVERLRYTLAELKGPAEEKPTVGPPEEIFLQWWGDEDDEYLIDDECLVAGVTWSSHQVWPRDVRYVRAEAWRPMGGDLPSTVIEIRRRARVFPAAAADEPPAVGTDPHGWFVCWWTDGNAWKWRPMAGSSATEGKES